MTGSRTICLSSTPNGCWRINLNGAVNGGSIPAIRALLKSIFRLSSNRSCNGVSRPLNGTVSLPLSQFATLSIRSFTIRRYPPTRPYEMWSRPREKPSVLTSICFPVPATPSGISLLPWISSAPPESAATFSAGATSSRTQSNVYSVFTPGTMLFSMPMATIWYCAANSTLCRRPAHGFPSTGSPACR